MRCVSSDSFSSAQEAILDQQQSERTDTGFKRSCLFCGLVVTGNRAPLFQHMLDAHGFIVGQPDNLGGSPTLGPGWLAVCTIVSDAEVMLLVSCCSVCE